MSDDLVKRLRDLGDHASFEPHMHHAAADRIEQLEREAQLQAQEIDKTRRRVDKWQSMVLDCEEYLKPGETPRQRMDRDHADVLALMKLLGNEKRKSERLEAKLSESEALLAKALGLLEAWIGLAAHCTIEEGVCCCGDNMDTHANPMDCGHSPVDHGAYIAKSLAEETNATLAELTSSEAANGEAKGGKDE